MFAKFTGLLLVVCLITPSLIFADYEVIIGESTTLTQFNPYCPFRTNSGTANIILRSELPSGAGGEILAIYFYMDVSSLNPSGYRKDIEMYMTQTSNIEVKPETPLSEGTLVFDQDAIYDNFGWIAYNLDTPFNWDSDNLLITMNSELTYLPPGFPPDNYFRYSTTSGNLSGWVNRNDWTQPATLTDGIDFDIDNKRPNMKIVFRGEMGIDDSRFAKNNSIQAFPNPFNSSVKIVFDNPIDASCVEIFDINGCRIAEIPRDDTQEEALVASSYNEFVWTPDHTIPSGVYLVRSTEGQNPKTAKLVFMK